MILAEHEFEQLVQRSEQLAKGIGPNRDPTEFEWLVADALDRLPRQFQRVLDSVPVIISDRGAEHGAYGLYQGGSIAHDYYHDRIVIFQDTLVRDFGHNPELLAAQIERTVRHELAHHLGWDEPGVRGLGL